MNNTMHGRKEIRQGFKYKKNNVFIRFLLFTISILIVGIVIGKLTSHKEQQNETIMSHVNTYGQYDNITFTSEPSMNWSVEDDFQTLNVNMDKETQEFVYYLSQCYNMDWTLVMAIIEQESNFDSECISSTDDYGLMQINKNNHKWLTNAIGVTNYLDSEQNIRAGMFVLRKLFEEYSDTDMVLMCYNMGEHGATKLWNKGIYSTTYTQQVRKRQKVFKEQLQRKDGTN